MITRDAKKDGKFRALKRKRLTAYELRVRRMRRQERLVEFECRRLGIEPALKFRDYRYWECKCCGFDPDIEEIFTWFSRLHWRQREELITMSRFLRRFDAGCIH